MGLILDTSAIVAWERAQDADQVISLEGNEELVMPAVVWAEALAGIEVDSLHMGGSGSHPQTVLSILDYTVNF